MEDLGILVSIVGFCLLSFRFTDFIQYLSKWQKSGFILLFVGLIIMVFFFNFIDSIDDFLRGFSDGFNGK
ncbi:hypothetical protein P7H60_10995 [Vagococcus carniphilus]|uniref:hypothetical protein n=1 Tax=Vagococcus carniphilus TaxID=218144 RepID=UPI00288D795B|nr:hypothetical protein [Vagococcus carniphilus]MDT2813563.1 hypothetical protein [Vagococcus carniphilus]MDT2849667.1 hypothetical protein [Vagococcus carniphilus]MDT2865678.1 hypothetical protein [Vagococcus carniphilus]